MSGSSSPGSVIDSNPLAPGSGHGRLSTLCNPSSERSRSSTSSAMRRYVVSLPPATLSMPAGPAREDRLAARAHDLARRRPGARADPHTPRARARGRASAESSAMCRFAQDLLGVRGLRARRRRDRRRTATSVVPSRSIPDQGTANVTRTSSWGSVKAALPVGASRNEDVRSPAQPDRGPGLRVLEPAHVVDPGPAAFTTCRASTATSLPSTRTSAPTRRPSSCRRATTSARFSTHAPASAAARTFARQRRASFVVASA